MVSIRWYSQTCISLWDKGLQAIISKIRRNSQAIANAKKLITTTSLLLYSHILIISIYL